MQPPLRWGSRRWLEQETARTIVDVQPTDIRIRLPGYDFDLALRHRRRLWQRRPRKWCGMPVCGFWILGHYGEIADVYMKLGDYESNNMEAIYDYLPGSDEQPMEGWEPGAGGPAWHYVDPADLAYSAR